MAKVILLSEFNSSFAAAATRYAAVGVGGSHNNATEVQTQITHRVAGTFNLLYAKLLTNTRNGATTIRFRVNGANGNQVLSIGSSTSGEFEDNSNSDTIIATDEVSYSNDVAGSSGSVVVHLLSCVFDASSNTAYRFVSGGSISFSTASVTRYQTAAGRLVDTSTEAESKLRIRQSITAKNLYTYINSNARTTTTTFRTRKNGANGGQSLSVTSSATGVFEDTVNSDTLADGDDFNYSRTTSTGTGSIAYFIISTVMESSDDKFCLMAGNTGSGAMGFGTTLYDGVGGKIPNGATESDQSHESNIDFTASKLGVYIRNNTINGATSVTFRKNSTDQSLTLSVTASTSGLFEDTSNSCSVSLGDEIDVARVAAGSSGSLNLAQIRVVGLFVAPASSAIKTFLGLVYASTKTVDGLAIASVKTAQGLA